ncbi:hypothetical protein H6G76_15900 [Nostoc sp. FACHB-152]|uniref:hypothetical protein n=1 Tax=unclassified Nostoc TaxID=2593658 RepID=UPI0016833638|nr:MULTISPECIES: hypothetical protein [unclassified Nostoc]MBD2448609.1 hypothetical protein [Nostoc sp. FACHB-152]MBD2469923.1 hypothetical protein [Nostoc sp. FACHB-145]
MDIDRFENEYVYTKFTQDELLILNNALNEICNNLDESEFSVRIGVDIEKANKLLHEFHQIFKMIDNLT